MLRRVITSDEHVEIILLCDPAVWAAQLRAARDFIAEQAPKIQTGDFVEMFVEAIKHAVGSEHELTVALNEVKAAGDALLSGFLTGEEKARAEERFKKELDDADVRECLAWVRAQNAAQAYRSSSDRSRLMVADPAGATKITIKPVSQDEQRKIERSIGARPRLGAIHYAKAADTGRKAARRGLDSAEAFAAYLQDLDPSELRAVEDYEDWQERVDREVCRKAIVSIDGFDLEVVGDEYPVGDLISQLGEQARDVITEIALHCRQVSTLGKSVRLPVPSPLGKRVQSGDPDHPPKVGRASNARQPAAESSPDC